MEAAREQQPRPSSRSREQQIEAAPATPTSEPGIPLSTSLVDNGFVKELSPTTVTMAQQPDDDTVRSLIDIKQTATRALRDILARLVQDAGSIGSSAINQAQATQYQLLIDNMEKIDDNIPQTIVKTSAPPNYEQKHSLSPSQKKLISAIKGHLRQRTSSAPQYKTLFEAAPSNELLDDIKGENLTHKESIDPLRKNPTNSVYLDSVLHNLPSNNTAATHNRRSESQALDHVNSLNESVSCPSATTALPMTLDENPSDHVRDYNLACALALLLEGVYGLLDETLTRAPTPNEPTPKTATIIPQNNTEPLTQPKISCERRLKLWSQLDESISEISTICSSIQFDNEMAPLFLARDQLHNDDTDSMTTDFRSSSVESTLISRSITSSPTSTSKGKKLIKDVNKSQFMVRRVSEEMEDVLNAIDKFQTMLPRMDNQCVTMVPVKQLPVTLTRVPDKQMRQDLERMEKVRVDALASEDDWMMGNIVRANRSTMMNQSVVRTASVDRRLEFAKLAGLLERLSTSRMYNQEYQQKTEYRPHGIEQLRHEIAKLSSPAMIAQRFELSRDKELDLYISSFMHRIDRLNDREQLEQQAADGPGVRKEAAFKEIDVTLNRMFKDQPSLGYQRYTHSVSQ